MGGGLTGQQSAKTCNRGRFTGRVSSSLVSNFCSEIVHSLTIVVCHQAAYCCLRIYLSGVFLNPV